MTGSPVLIVEDDDDARRVLSDLYRRAGHEPVGVGTGHDALRELFTCHPQLVLLDLSLPDLDGLTVLERIRDVSDVPVLVVTGVAVESSRLDALFRGADDLVTKPFATGDLLARSHRLIRRHQSHQPLSLIDDGTVQLDLVQRTVTVDGEERSLTATDWRLLHAFVSHPGVVLTPERLLAIAWHDPFAVGVERVKFAVLRLRRRLAWDGPSSPIQAVRGFGYRYQPKDRGACQPTLDP